VRVRFEIEVELKAKFTSTLSLFGLPEGFRELRVLEEKLAVDGQPVYTRQHAQVTLQKPARSRRERHNSASIGNLVALPIVQEQSQKDPLFIFKQWLARTLILRPVPSLISGDSISETLQPNPQIADFGAWFSGLLASAPAAYARIDAYLRQVMPDLRDIRNWQRFKKPGSPVPQRPNQYEYTFR
jgi:hypothetical protein